METQLLHRFLSWLHHLLAWMNLRPLRPPLNYTKIQLNHIKTLPNEILCCIFGMLHIADQICLAVCCKSYYYFFRSLLEMRDLNLSQLLRETRPVFCLNVEVKKSERVQLLRQLENAKWKFCFGCWNLHPLSAWKQDSCWKCDEIRGRRCAPCNGLVNLCPCLTITKLNQVELIRRLHSINSYPPD